MKHYFETYWDQVHRLWHCHCACGAGSYGMTIDEAQANAGATTATCTREVVPASAAPLPYGTHESEADYVKAEVGAVGAGEGAAEVAGEPHYPEAHPDQEADTQGF